MFTTKKSWLWFGGVVLAVLALVLLPGFRQAGQPDVAAAQTDGPVVLGPFEPTVFNGSLADLPQLEEGTPIEQEALAPGITGKGLPAVIPGFVDPVAQTWQGAGQMPDPIMNFPGLIRSEGGGWIPPDTNGDVGPNHYIQTVNIGIGIFDKATGAALVKLPYNSFFSAAPPPCNTANRGDVIVLYDQMADRWFVSDFSLPSGGPYYECIAVSQTGDPVGGGWYFYAFQAKPAGADWHDYPKIGVWPDAYYMTANIFNTSWVGSQVWALDRSKMLSGLPFTAVTFGPFPLYGSLLPSNLKGPVPPAGSPNYVANFEFPNTFNIWEFHVDFTTPANSTFTGPSALTIADVGYVGWTVIPQPAPGSLLDSLGDRLMMQLQYRNFGTHESLWVSHTAASGGVAGVRWYEIRDPGGAPVVHQQGTYQPDDSYRWMSSLAVDQDGNMAVGYSVSSPILMPAIRYAGRLNGEVLGTLPQGEATLIQGTGVQLGVSRWGDYSAMNIDPVDDCTFWYTQEYYIASGSSWVTRIGSFRFPSCGLPKGWVGGTVYDAVSSAPIPFAQVVAQSITTTLTVNADATGNYTMTLPAGTFTLVAGPVPPGYPIPTTVNGVAVTAGVSLDLDIPLTPMPFLEQDHSVFDDHVPGGNGNGAPEPGETGILFWNYLTNTGAYTATNVTAHLMALTPGVTVGQENTTYPDIAVGAVQANLTPFVISIDATIVCGAQLDFDLHVTSDQGAFTVPITILAGQVLPRTAFFSDNLEGGPANWTTGGSPNSWALTTSQSHSPTHSFTDSPAGNYGNNNLNWVMSAQPLDLTGQTGFIWTFWHRYDTENGFDFAIPQYSLDGGSTWVDLAAYSGSQTAWAQESFDLSVLANEPNVKFRFLFTSDGSVIGDGWYFDDVELTYTPLICAPPNSNLTIFLPTIEKN